ADEVAGDDVVAGAGLVEADPEGAVTGDDVALDRVGDTVGVTADQVGLGAAGNANAAVGVGQGGGAGGIGADQVAGDDVANRTGLVDEHAGGIAGDEVALGGVIDPIPVGADDVVVGTLDERHADLVGPRPRAVGAEGAVLDVVARGGGAADLDAG